jgi:hypothetical protein
VNVTLVPIQNVLSASELVNVGVGNELTVLFIPADVAEHPFELVTTTSTPCPFRRVLVVYVDDDPF